MPTARIPGASVWEQEVYDHLVTHGEEERGILEAYEQAAEETSSPAFAYLARLILDDERRHHAILKDLAETVRVSAELSGRPVPIPDLAPVADRDHLLALTERFLEMERDDQRELARLAKMLADVKDTTLWQFVVRLIEHDNTKHREILEFIKGHLVRR